MKWIIFSSSYSSFRIFIIQFAIVLLGLIHLPIHRNDEIIQISIKKEGGDNKYSYCYLLLPFILFLSFYIILFSPLSNFLSLFVCWKAFFSSFPFFSLSYLFCKADFIVGWRISIQAISEWVRLCSLHVIKIFFAISSHSFDFGLSSILSSSSFLHVCIHFRRECFYFIPLSLSREQQP